MGSSGERGVVGQAAFDGGEPDRAGADRVGQRREPVPGRQPELSQLVAGRQVLGRVDLAEPSGLARSEASFAQFRAEIATPPVYYLTQRFGA